MWLITPEGFYSAVQKRGEKTLTIRARDEGDLNRLVERLPPGAKVVRGGGTDYPFRISGVTHAEWAKVLAGMALDIDYDNFKTEVGKKQGKKRASVYGRLWSVLLDLEPKSLRRWTGRYDRWDDEPLFKN